MVDVAVIGAGVGGLASAIDLAARGASVTVYDAADVVGGKLGYTMVGDIRCDTGPSLLTMRHVFDDLFANAGVRLEDSLTLLPHHESTLYRWDGGDTLMLFGEASASVASVERTLGPAAAAQFRDFLAYSERIWDAAAPAFVYADAPTIRGSVGQLRSLTRIDPLRSMADAIRAHVKHPRLRDVLFRFATYNGSDARKAPATLNCIAHVELSMGTYGIRGGMYELAIAMRNLAESLGAQFRLGTRVHRIVRDSAGRVIAVDTDAGTQPVAAVVGNADAAHVLGPLLGASEPDFEPSMSGWNAIVRTSRRVRAPHEVMFPEHYEQEFADIFDRGREPQSPTVYVCSPEVSHQSPGEPEHELLFVMANAPAVGETDADALRTRVLDVLRRHEVIDPTATVEWERTPRELAARFPGSRGAIYGSSSNSRFAAFRRPQNRVAEVPGLYLASGSAHPGGGVPMCTLSGRAAARALAADFELPAATGSG